MKTLLSRFCEEFEGVVRPLLAPLGEAADTLGGVGPELGVREVLPGLREVAHHLSTLSDKVAEQQAYVLIFGPLKSGKSTLMNAVAAAYVSEVTTLPAYPCMVYVSHAPRRSFTVTRYNGKKETFSDVEAMRSLMEWAHAELANTIREVENRGESFDPALHSPQAIRRVDVHVPAPHLRDSSAVLVDTPGLYARMKFGYDRMTRDFRDAAACAVFVVKTDNLFLEQVFEEFNELLELFSRIFLLVNVDSTKRDLHPAGELRPSLEGEHPERIVTAFENLAMSAPLKRAAEEGRLSIYPVDLLCAAAGRLRGGRSGAAAGSAESDDAAAGAAASAAGDPVSAEERRIRVATEAFERFLDELTEYLNSTDYLVAFLGDSLRQARGLFDELRRTCELDAVVGLSDEVARLAERRARCASVAAAAERLGAHDWQPSFRQLEADLKSIVQGRIATRRDATADAVQAAVDRWFEGDGSFRSLVDDYVAPVVRDVQQDLVRTARGVFETVASGETAGAQVPPQVREDLAAVELALGEVGRASAVAAAERVAPDEAPVHLTTGDVPVRRSLLDWIVFRSRAAVRRRLFGPDDAADRPVPRHVKLRRIGEAGREQLRAALRSDLDRFFDEALAEVAGQMLVVYVRALRDAVAARLEQRATENAHDAELVEKRLAELASVREAIAELEHSLATRETLLGELTRRYGETDPQRLTEPYHEAEEPAGAAGGYSKAIEEGSELAATGAAPGADEVAVRRRQALDEYEADADDLAEEAPRGGLHGTN